MVQALEKVSEILAQARGNLTVEEQVQQLLQSLQHDSASVKATALQVTHAALPSLAHMRTQPPPTVLGTTPTQPWNQREQDPWCKLRSSRRADGTHSGPFKAE